MIKSVLALIIALLFFANYSEVIKGLNNISTEASALIISGQANTVVNDNNNIENPTTQSMFSESIWNVFVHKPYLYLQYGTMNEDEIGKGRIEQLLRAKPNSDTRDDIVLKEVTERGNPMMTRTKLIEKITFQFITMFSFMINSIPVLLLSFSLLLFQFWFLAIGMIAPFVFIWGGALPNQFGVIIRYFLELIIPLALKLAVSVIALVVFMLTNVLMNSVMSTFTSSSILSFIVLSWCQLALWTTFFLLRKRIFRIFSLGSQQIGYLREEIKNVYTDPLKSAVSKTATVGGAVAGGIVTGTPQGGAMMGASVGGSLGGVATGENDVGSATRTVATTGMMYDRMNKNQAISDQKEAESMQQLEIQQTKDDFQEKLMSQHGIAEPMAKEATQKLHEKGIDLNAVDDELVNTSMSEIQQEIEEKRPKEDFATNFSNKVHGKVFDQKLENETNQLKSTGNIDHGKDHQTEVHADKSINTEEIPLEKLDNYSKSNNESTPLQTPKLDTNSQQFSNEPKDIPIVTEPMHQGTESGTSIEITKFDQSDVENNGINPQPIRESKINSNSPKGNSIPTNNHNTKDTQQEFIENDIPTQDIPKREVSNTGNNTNQEYIP
ncbi:membrane protein [Gracilibacillus boraciitolerans JCM 21714]|uniref:Membrane protein n=1 Tax=Gracilibacillus boraciitolerans JCM 21714 TaxID=1298598 RepID=W4VJQ5_9BACI|nr:glycine zipper family protein [Gracilibacillus boraciitolerans]GAE93053.1 membrane protein [Gracilibacillus boraciitolerans JCM 21714]